MGSIFVAWASRPGSCIVIKTWARTPMPRSRSLRRRHIDRARLATGDIARPKDQVVYQCREACPDDRADPVNPMRCPKVRQRRRSATLGPGADEGRAEAALRVHAGAGDRPDGEDVGGDDEPDP